MNIEVSSNNDAIEKRWQKFYIKTMIQVLVFTFFVEIGMYFFLDKFNLIGTTTSTYIIRYLVNPTVNNIIILLVFIGTSKLFKSIYVKTYLLLTGFVLMLLNIALVHNYFMVTLLMFCVPSFTSVFFQKKRYVYYSMTLSVLSICVVYCQVKWGYAKSWADSKYMASAVVTILIVIICSVIASRIAGVLEAQTKRMKELTMQALEANETKSKFLSIATHELRTPLNAISGMVDMMRRDGANPGQEKYLRSIKNASKSMLMLVNDILDQTKIEAGKMEIVCDDYDVNNLIDELKLIIETRIGEKPIKLVIHIDDDLPKMLNGDALRIRQILINLMNNAVKFTDKGKIELSIKMLEQREDRLLLRFGVKDSGQGISEEDIKKLFTAFSQVNVGANHSKEGTGLGLSISKDFIELMGGKLEVESKQNVGSEFFFIIEQGIGANDDKKDENVITEHIKLSDAKVLVVDDTAINTVIFESLLGLYDITPDTAESGDKALGLIQNKKYDLVFMDYLMPEMDGLQTTENIRNLVSIAKEVGNDDMADYYEKLPVVILSADSSHDTKLAFEKAGANDFAEKPITEERLTELLTKYLVK